MMLVEQDVLKTKEGCAKFLRMIQDDELRGKVEDEIQKVKTSVERWHAFIEVANLFNKQMVCIFYFNRWTCVVKVN